MESGTVRQDCAPAGLDFVFHMFFLVKYSKSLEEGSFRGRSADFLWMLLFGGLRHTPANDFKSERCHLSAGPPVGGQASDQP